MPTQEQIENYLDTLSLEDVRTLLGELLGGAAELSELRQECIDASTYMQDD